MILCAIVAVVFGGLFSLLEKEGTSPAPTLEAGIPTTSKTDLQPSVSTTTT